MQRRKQLFWLDSVIQPHLGARARSMPSRLLAPSPGLAPDTSSFIVSVSLSYSATRGISGSPHTRNAGEAERQRQAVLHDHQYRRDRDGEQCDS